MAPVLRPPSRGSLGWEALAGFELFRLLAVSPALLRAPRGDRAVLVLPGFAADDASTLPLRAFLRRLGYSVVGWGFGRNRGDVAELVPRVASLALEVGERHGEPVHLIGQSLGGVLAREVARDHPQAVAQVLTLGTPVVGGPAFTALHRRYPAREIAEIDATIRERNRVPISVPITAIYSKRDGIVNWQACLDTSNPRATNVEVGSSHFGMGIDPAVWRLAAQLLATGS
ncbi:MAG TPA: alpha/beta hydrolase [Thermoleophilaceae bacterium]|nr:alpha/beta hydrolase [Thermoleophilaceae bacterium]